MGARGQVIKTRGSKCNVYFLQVFSSIELEPKYVLLIVGAIYQVRQLLLKYSSSNSSHFFTNVIVTIAVLIKPLHYFCCVLILHYSCCVPFAA